jgi:hypothetical protein
MGNYFVQKKEEKKEEKKDEKKEEEIEFAKELDGPTPSKILKKLEEHKNMDRMREENNKRQDEELFQKIIDKYIYMKLNKITIVNDDGTIKIGLYRDELLGPSKYWNFKNSVTDNIDTIKEILHKWQWELKDIYYYKYSNDTVQLTICPINDIPTARVINNTNIDKQ